MLNIIQNTIGALARKGLSVIRNGLKMWLPFEKSGSDLSGNSNNATLYTGKALSFDGVNDYVDLSGFTLDGDTITMSLWADFTSEGTIFDATGGSTPFLVRYKSGGIRISNGATSYDVAGVSSNVGFKRFVIVYDSSDFKVYADGTQLGSTVSSVGTLNLSNHTAVRVGYKTNNSSALGGNISDFQIYNSAWTQDDVTFDYNNPQHLVTDNSELRYGSEEVTKGDFEGITQAEDTTGADWTTGTGWSIGSGVASCDGTSGVSMHQNILGVQDNIYAITVTVSNYTSGTLQIGGSSNNLEVDANGTYTYHRTWTSDSNLYFKSKAGAGFTGSISNISVKEIVSPTLNNLKGYWHLSEGDGSIVYDSSGEGNDGTSYDGNADDHDGDGTIIGATWDDQQATIPQLGLMDWAKSTPVADEITLIADPNNPSEDILGNSVRLREHSLNLDGIGYAEVPDADNLDFGTGDFSIEAWAKYRYINTNSSFNIVVTLGGSFPNNTSAAIVTDSTQFKFYIGSSHVDSTTTLVEGQWYHIVGTRTGATLRLYVDKTSEGGTANSSLTVTNVDTKRIGRDSTLDRPYQDLIDDVRIYDRALSADEVEQNYKAGLNKHKTGSSFSDDFSSDYGF